MANQILNATLKFYIMPFSEEANFYLDDFADFIAGSTVQLQVEDFQFLYPAISKEIKVRITDKTYDPINLKVNYLSVTSNFSGTTQTIYYFIQGIDYVDTDTVKLMLKMDSLHSSYASANDIPFTERTKVIRKHKNRYKRDIAGAAQNRGVPIIDQQSEGVSVTKVVDTETHITDSFGKWYLLYKTALPTEGVTENPVSVYLVPKNPAKVVRSATNLVVSATNLEFGVYYHVMFQPFTSITIDGHTFTYGTAAVPDEFVGFIFTLTTDRRVQVWLVGRDDRQGGVFVRGSNYAGTSMTIRGGTSAAVCSKIEGDTPDVFQSEGAMNSRKFDTYLLQATNPDLITIDNVDRSNSRILKIISLPYLPINMTEYSSGIFNMPTNGTYVGGYLKLNLNHYLSNKPKRNLPSVSLAKYNSITLPANVSQATSTFAQRFEDDWKEEPKLLHSDFYTVKFVFDSFYYELALEKLGNNRRSVDDFTRNRIFDIEFIPSFNVSSSFMFHIYPASGTIEATTDYEGYFAVRRNNELPIFNAPYIDYLRNGYNYDQKAKALTQGTQIAQLGISAIGALAGLKDPISMASGVGLGLGAASSLGSLGVSFAQNQMALAAKISNLQNQGVSISGADDLDLLEEYSPDLKIITYFPIAIERKAILDSLRLYGYSDGTYGVPNTKTRLWFDFLQCEADFDKAASSRLSPEVEDEIKSKLRNGVTFLHRVNNTYDINQEKENWERSLIGL